MSDGPRQALWKIYAKGGAMVLGIYFLLILLLGTAYPSVRIADPIRIGPDLRMSSDGEVYQGKLVVLGWPFRCVAWREEAKEPIGTANSSAMRIVATSISWVAVALNLTGVWSAYTVVALVIRFFAEGSTSLQQVAIVALCVVLLGAVVALRDRGFLKPIPVYVDEVDDETAGNDTNSTMSAWRIRF